MHPLARELPCSHLEAPLFLLLALLACGDKGTDDTASANDGGTTHDGGATDDGGTSQDGGTGALDLSRTQLTDGGTYTVTWSPSAEPVLSEEFAISVSAEASPMPEGGFTFTSADARMPDHDHGMNVTPVVTDHGDGSATAAPFQLQMEGWWTITVTLTADDGAVETATFNHICCE